MATYPVSAGQTISDTILNSTGNIGAWDAFLTANNFDDWTPSLFSGQLLQIPDDVEINSAIVAALATYPANNFTVPDIASQIAALFDLLATSTPIPSVNTLIPATENTNNYYHVKHGETIADVILNSTGSIFNWGTYLAVNNFDDWTPGLFSGQQLIIPANAMMNLNNYRALTKYPANNFTVTDLDQQIFAIFELLNNPVQDWILGIVPGFWSDTGNWRDGAVWID